MPPRTTLRGRRAVQRDIDRYIGWLRSESQVGLHLGCGPDLIPGLINCDAYHPGADRALGACELVGFADGSVDYIETHHMIEHLSFAEGKAAVCEWARVLKPTGKLVVTCPDFSKLVGRWKRSSCDENWSSTIRMIYGSQEHEGMFHKSGYDAASLTRLLAGAGFDVLLAYSPYPRRPTPSLCVIAQRR